MSKKINVGIVGTGIYLPKQIMTAKEISDATGGVWSEDAVRNKLGINQKYIPGPGPEDGTQEMGALAAIDCLKNTGVDPKDIDVIFVLEKNGKISINNICCIHSR
jgi:3-oxoacyl-[acyl-carrier-protein] synthase-3